MKTKFLIIPILALVGFISFACSDDSENNYESKQSAATIKSLHDSTRILQLDQDNVLKASNMKDYAQIPDGRVIVTYEDHGLITTPAGYSSQWHSGKITKLEPIATYKPVEYGDSVVSNDRIEVLLNNPMTCVQDGYLTIAYEVGSCNKDIQHHFTLQKTEKPLVFQLHHDNGGDISASHVKEGVIAFDLRDLVPTNGEKHNIVIKYMGFGSAKTISIFFDGQRYNAPALMVGHETPMECYAC